MDSKLVVKLKGVLIFKLVLICIKVLQNVSVHAVHGLLKLVRITAAINVYIRDFI